MNGSERESSGKSGELPWYADYIVISESTRFGIVAETVWWAFLLTLVFALVSLGTLAFLGVVGWSL